MENEYMKRRDFLRRAGAATSISALLSGCMSEEGEQEETETTESYSEGSGKLVQKDIDAGDEELKVFYDEEGEMVCYVHRDGWNAASTGGMDCEPIDETAYNESDFE